MASYHPACVEGRREVAHREPAVILEGDGDHVETAAHVAEALPLEVLLGEADEAPSLPPLHSGARAVVPARAPALHLDEDPGVAVAADEVELALPEPHVALDDDEAGALEVARRGVLGGASAKVTRVGHDAWCALRRLAGMSNLRDARPAPVSVAAAFGYRGACPRRRPMTCTCRARRRSWWSSSSVSSWSSVWCWPSTPSRTAKTPGPRAWAASCSLPSSPGTRTGCSRSLSGSRCRRPARSSSAARSGGGR